MKNIEQIKNLFDVQQLLKIFGIYIYLGKRIYDIELMDIELKNLYKSGLIDEKIFRQAAIVLRYEHRLEEKREERKKKCY